MADDADLRALPAVHALADQIRAETAAPWWACAAAARAELTRVRAARRAGAATQVASAAALAVAATRLAARSLRRVINATGVVLHTNLGRAPLAAAAVDAAVEAAGYANLELDLATGERGSRHAHVATLAAAACGAEAALVVNNNAAATVLALAALADDREVIVSRGELVEIGGAFRVPDILRLSRCRLVEVGTTNRTRLADYTSAIGPATALLLKVHRSNFAILGFTEEVDAAALAALARSRGLVSMLDLGAGALLPTATQRALGLPAEPAVPDVLASGIDLVCFSGDKLLGGPQAGLLVGKAAIIERLRGHPLLRALRPDKLTLAALEATLRLYRDGAWRDVPTLAALATPLPDLEARARRLLARLPSGAGEVVPCTSTVGGGAMPLAALPSAAVALAGHAEALDHRLRTAPVPVVGRIHEGRLHLDVRTISDDEFDAIAAALTS